MSGLIETIVRRRRASASSRLGPPSHLLESHPWAEEISAPDPVDGLPSRAEDRHAADELHGSSSAVNGHPADAVAPLEADIEADPLDEERASPPTPSTPVGEPEEFEDQPTAVFSAVAAEPEPEPEPAATLAVADPPAPADAQSFDEPYPSLRQRIRLRRRARYLASVREVQLRDLGGFLLELHRFGRQRPDLVRAKLDAAAATDAELRSLHHRLDEEAPIGELRRPGVGGACASCGAVHGSLDRFCASCGAPLR